ncbi:DUF4405 domain-containing protein [Roseateles sp. BYS87W]|uniref:DUF4405 domain-containing protein n=1 Tax=Pelomonas baiyunensis TaxID=3299026 RepID=A0ABW7GWR9_9BURK
MTAPTVPRHWATPVVMACFTVMAATGVLMFFRWQSPLQKEIHEWLGWGLLAAVLMHVLANLPAFKRHFAGPRQAVALLTVAVLVAGGSYFVRPADGKGPSVSALAVQALARAPLHTVADVFGLPVPSARQALADAGLTLADDNTSIDTAAQGNRERVGKALKALAKAAPQPAR